MSQRGNVVFYDSVITHPQDTSYDVTVNNTGALHIDYQTSSLSLGLNAAQSGQGNGAIAIGPNAAQMNQNNYSVAIGNSAGHTNQGIGCIAIGSGAAMSNQGDHSVAIGNNAGHSVCNPGDIILNGGGETHLDAVPDQDASFYVNPIRAVEESTGVLTYNNSTHEVSQTSNVTLNTVVASGQIRSVGPTGVREITNGANITIDLRNKSFVFINDGLNNILTATNYNFGDHLYIQLAGSGTVDFYSGFAVSNRYMTKGGALIHFICDGAHMVEVSRSAWDIYVYP
jgi:hypothetical protein